MKLIAIFATDRSGGFGLGGKLPWGKAAPQDLKHFKEVTMGGVMLMGGNTYDSVSHLEGRSKVVVSSADPRCFPKASIVAPTISQALDEIRNSGVETVYVIGGAQLLKSILYLVDEIIYSEIKGTWVADTYLDVKNTLQHREFIGSKMLPDSTVVKYYGGKVAPVDNRSALEVALDREQKTTFGNIPIKSEVEFTEDEAVPDAMDITKQMIRGRS